MQADFRCILNSLCEGDYLAYQIGIFSDDIKDLIIAAMKLHFEKTDYLILQSAPNKLIRLQREKDGYLLELDQHHLPIDRRTAVLMMTFLLDATEKYMCYDHIDMELTDTGNRRLDITICKTDKEK